MQAWSFQSAIADKDQTMHRSRAVCIATPQKGKHSATDDCIAWIDWWSGSRYQGKAARLEALRQGRSSSIMFQRTVLYMCKHFWPSSVITPDELGPDSTIKWPRQSHPRVLTPAGCSNCSLGQLTCAQLQCNLSLPPCFLSTFAWFRRSKLLAGCKALFLTSPNQS